MIDLDKLRAAKQAAKAAFGHLAGVQGFGIGAEAIRAYVRDTDVAKELPKEIDGVDVECVVVGEITAAPAPDDDPA